MEEQGTTECQHGRKLYKSTSERMVDGVCAGIADYFNIDPSAVRLSLIAFTIFSFGAGIVFYVVAMIVMPTKPPDLTTTTESLPGYPRRKNSEGGIITGIVILIIGAILLFHHYNISPPWFGIFDFRLVGRLALPIILILIGSIILIGRERESISNAGSAGSSVTDNPFMTQPESEKKRLFRSVRDAKVTGVCGGLGEYLKIDTTVVRLSVVLLSLASFGMALILYFACALVIPKEKI